MSDETRDEAGRLVSVVVDGQRFHRADEGRIEAIREGYEALTELRNEARRERDAALAEVRSLRGVVQAQRVRLAAVEALLPFSDAEYPIYPSQLREALGAEESDFLLIPRAALAAAADAPQPSEDQR